MRTSVGLRGATGSTFDHVAREAGVSRGLVAVFAVFIATGVPSIQQIGLGTAVAIALDATLVRLVLVPATMELLGKWNWYVPRLLARLLPRADLEAVAQPVS
jgi:uncharacterized membrane protein YdfJ with MMPL/SSD domain